MLEQIIFLLKEGYYYDMLRSGLISIKIDCDFNIYNTYHKHLRSGCKKMEALGLTADEHKVHECTVYNALKTMRF